jgi:hypothetical protein
MISTIRPGVRAMQQISDDKVLVETGKTWQEWVDAINLCDGNTRELLSVIECLIGRYGLTHLWASTIASYYLMEQSEEYADA